jgi:hypothetical protein
LGEIGSSIAISFVIVSFKFGNYFASFLDALTSLLYCVARIYSFAGHQRLGGVNFRSGNSLIQPTKSSNIL